MRVESNNTPEAACAPAPRHVAPHHWPTLAAGLAALASAAVLLLAGCASSAGIAPHAQAITPESVGLAVTAARTDTPEIATAWWQAFGDDTLNGLVERALAGSPNLKLAEARVARAAAAVSGAEAADGPQVNAGADVTRQRFSANSIYPPPLGGSIRTLATAQFNASWEFDFFGRNRAALDAALGAERAARADAGAARQWLASQVARTYVQLARLQAQREVAAGALKQRENTLALIGQRVRSGLDSKVELRQGEGALPESRLQIEQLDEQVMLARHALAALTAQPAAALDALDATLARLRSVALPATVPADLLGRRADIAAARARVEAATGEARSATAQFYPNINLAGFVGLSSMGLDRLLNSDSQQFGGGPAIRLPIFDAGRLRANLRVKTADVDAAVESYNTTVIEAVRDAADQVASLQSGARQQAEQALAQAAAESAYDLAQQRYKAGLSSYLVVLSAEGSVLNQRRTAVDLTARALDTQIALIRALGGGYRNDDTARTARADTETRPPTTR